MRMNSLTKVAVVSVIGNALEMYDFCLYGIFASAIAKAFFSQQDYALLLSLATFAVGFVMRPLGGLLFGYLGDRLGRKPALTISIFLMAFSTFVISVLPTHDQIGIIAPYTLVLCRLMQGLSAGGEYNGAGIFLMEHFQKNKKSGFAGSLISASGGIGALFAIFLSSFLLQPYMPSWSWRIAFLIGSLLAFVGFYLRSKIRDTPDFEALSLNKSLKSPLAEIFVKYPLSVLCAIGIGVLQGTFIFYIFVYENIYLTRVLGFSLGQSTWACSVILITFTLFTPLFGFLSDKIGHVKTMYIGVLCVLLGSYPYFLFLNSQIFSNLILSNLLFGIFIAFFIGPANAFMNQLFPVQVKYTGIAFSYCVGSAIFGGTMPLISTYLIGHTGNKLIPAFYLMMAAFIGLCSLKMARSFNLLRAQQ